METSEQTKDNGGKHDFYMDSHDHHKTSGRRMRHIEKKRHKENSDKELKNEKMKTYVSGDRSKADGKRAMNYGRYLSEETRVPYLERHDWFKSQQSGIHASDTYCYTDILNERGGKDFGNWQTDKYKNLSANKWEISEKAATDPYEIVKDDDLQKWTENVLKRGSYQTKDVGSHDEMERQNNLRKSSDTGQLNLLATTGTPDVDEILSLDTEIILQYPSAILTPINDLNELQKGPSFQSDLHSASDVVADVVCTPCEVDGSREEAQQFCSTCQEYLCSTCARCHQRMKATKEHKLTNLPNGSKGSAEKYVKCWYHPDRNIEMYCTTHDMVYCVRCIATEHRSCEGVTDVENVASNGSSIRHVQTLQHESKLMYDQLVACDKKKEKSLKSTKDLSLSITSKINETKQKMIQHFESLERNAIRALQKAQADIESDIEAEKSNIGKMIETMGDRNQKLENACQMGNAQRFIQVKLSKMAISNARQLFDLAESKSEKVIDYTENDELIKSILTGENLYAISIHEQ